MDIYGRRDKRDDQWVGVQCKLKGDTEEVSERELKAEVEKAKEFRPKLAEFILTTTAPDDAKIQKAARDISQANAKADLFSVAIWGWQTLEREIAHHAEALAAFHPDISPFSQHQQEIADETLTVVKQFEERFSSVESMLQSLQHAEANPMRTAGEVTTDNSTSAQEQIENHLHQEIDGYRDLIRAGRAETARALLEELKRRAWKSASNRVRFRIVTNIGAATLQLGEPETAGKIFLDAIQYDPDDRIGLANVSLANILRGDNEAAIKTAESALAHDSGNSAAAAHLIAASQDREEVLDPLSLVPEEVRHSSEVLISAMNFYSLRGDNSWRALARESVQRHPQDSSLKRRAAEAILDEAFSSEGFHAGGLVPEKIKFEEVEAAAAVLRELWESERRAEGGKADISLALNLTRALWALGDSERATKVLDQALERQPAARELRELRAGLYFESGDVPAALGLVQGELGDPGLALVLAEERLESDPKRSREILESEIISRAPPYQQRAAKFLISETFLKEGLGEAALEHARSVVQEHGESVDVLTALSRIERETGENGADETLSRAMQALTDETPFLERVHLAVELDRLSRYEDVASILDGRIDRTHDSPGLRLLLSALINADRRAASYELLGGLPANVAAVPYFQSPQLQFTSTERTL